MIAKAREIARDKEDAAAKRLELRSRADEVLCREITFIDNPEFREMQANEAGRESTKIANSAAAVGGRSSNSNAAHLGQMCSTPLLSPDQEQDLFRRMNYCKWRANAIRSTLDASRPNIRMLTEIEQLMSKATQLRNEIVSANTRLVVSIVKKLADSMNSFDELLSEGLNCLIRVVDKFDFSRGFRFSTYATLAVRREVFRLVTHSHRDRSRFTTGATETLYDQAGEVSTDKLNASTFKQLNTSLMRLIDHLDEREQFIVKARFGFLDVGEKPSFSRLGAKLGVSKERVRQLEMRAMNKVRNLVVEMNMGHLESMA